MKELNSVPERDVDYTDSLQQLPIIDLSKLLSEDVKGAELEKLGVACKEWGFFQVSFHLNLSFSIKAFFLKFCFLL